MPRKFRLGPFRTMILTVIAPSPRVSTSRCKSIMLYPANHFAGTVTSSGKMTIRNSTTSCAIMNGQTPLMISSMLIRLTPQTTFSTTPTGGVIRPMALLMMNNTPKYTGSMPAVLMIGIRMGVRIRIVGVMSSAVPTITTTTMMANINNVLLPMKGFSKSTTWAEISDTVISQDDTRAAATRNMTMLVVNAAETNTS